ncbi:N-acetyllactosaminide beta-1,3-N-acetylglucosaminyltransferase 2 [Scleropages formosus]|uniref:Hexosyltransferase n=1 Tax=Scleropages formosus TaxID=113540 RepID=A0A8C9S611_SCLFO|nr:N-acetyllactosaminide beta-1,3-N-acetylglucosaminyltransferase 2-like [Scleropages formosus]XP_018584359.2 N-acetyllactosaminide beta-1,3-N-acetylglucosaminyltransferase 2-like [Scleropages formosus]XP_018584360.2 N-acetyllactosaminide beta-1,3-N-acetylglucosaminyltransferase 2-like [Scleropages formosus]
MARSLGRLLCLCLMLCLMVGHLLIYVVVSIFVIISYHPSEVPVHFVAPGASSNSAELAAHPLHPFWNLRLDSGALWNHLQHPRDRLHNPILRGNDSSVAKGLNPPVEARPQDGVPACGLDRSWVPHLPDFDSFPDQMRDFVLSMHCTEYPLMLNQPGLCGEGGAGEGPALLIAVKSQTPNFESRQAIRQTWGASGWVKGEAGGPGGLVRTVFLLGRQDGSTGVHPELGELLEVESRRHGDILQWDFRDTFFNLTLKDVLFWRWFSANCPRARFVFKGDDDVFLRTRTLLDYLRQLEEERLNGTGGAWDFVVGDVISNAFPNRQPSDKYYIPESFYKGSYPAYAGGGGVVYSGELALHLREVSHRVLLFPIDDVYVGMCLHRLGISPTHHPGFMTFDLPEEDRGKTCAYHSVLLVHKRTPKEVLRLWSELQTPPPPC